MEPLKRLEVITEIVKIFEKNDLVNGFDKFWIFSGVVSAITSEKDPINVTFSRRE